VCRDEVSAFKPYLWHESSFESGARFRHWLLAKIINGERASYSAPKFARMQDRTRTQMLEDIVNNLANHLATGQIPKPYRRGSWRPIGHMRPSSPLLDSVRDLFEGYDQLSKDFSTAFNLNAKMICDVVFNVARTDRPNSKSIAPLPSQSTGSASADLIDATDVALTNGVVQTVQFADSSALDNRKLNKTCGCVHCHAPVGTVCVCADEDGSPSRRIFGVRAILAIRSRVFLEMLYGFSTVGSSQNANNMNQSSGGQLTTSLPAGGSMLAAEQLTLGVSQNKMPEISPEKKSKQQSVSIKRTIIFFLLRVFRDSHELRLRRTFVVHIDLLIGNVEKRESISEISRPTSDSKPRWSSIKNGSRDPIKQRSQGHSVTFRSPS
jgi:hypothetical protein